MKELTLKEKFEQITTKLQFDNNLSEDWLDKLPDLKNFVISAMQSAYDLAKSDGWISVEDRLPEHLQDVLYTHNKIKNMNGMRVAPTIITGFYRNGFHSWLSHNENMPATHWMNLPNPPKQ